MASESTRHNLDTQLNRIHDQVRQLHRRLKRKYLWSSIAGGFALLPSGLFLLISLEQQLYFSAAFKSLLWLFFVAGSLVLGWSLYQRWHLPPFETFYRKTARVTHLPGLQYAIDFKEYPRNADSAFLTPAIKQALESLEGSDLQERLRQFEVDHRATKNQRMTSFAGVFALLLFGVASLSWPGSMKRSLHFWNTYHKPNPFRFSIQPGDLTLEQGAQFKPSIHFIGNAPQKVTLAIKTDIESDYRERPMQPSEANSYRADPMELSNNASYYVMMDGYRSETHQVSVQLRPRFQDLSLRVTPPSYTGLDTSSYRYPFSQIEAYQGSQLTLKGRLNKPVDSFRLIRSHPADTLVVEPDAPRQYTISLNVSRPDTITFALTDRAGLTNKNPFRFTIKPMADQEPVVEILRPASSVQDVEPDTLGLTYRASDDFGLNAASLNYRIKRAFVDKPESHRVRLSTPPMETNASYIWNLEKLDLKPRDVVTFWITVSDNDALNGPKSARSRELTLQLPSMTQYFDQLDEQEQDVQSTIEEVSKSYEEMHNQYQRFKEQLREHPETNYQQQQTLDEVQKKQQKVDKKVEELNKKFDKVRRELERNNKMSNETLQKYNELKKLMNEINDPELKKALEELRKALGNMDKDELTKALQKMDFNEEMYRQRLQRTIDLFKSLKLNSDLEKMARSLESLAEQEKKISEQQGDPDSQLKQQESVRRDAQNMSQRLDSLSRQAPEKVKEEMKKLQEQSGEQMKSIDRQLQQNMRQLQEQGASPETQKQQQQIQQQMQQLAAKMRSAKQQLNKKQQRVNMAALQHILYSMINLSESQEELTQETEKLEPQSKAFVAKARTQKNIADQFARLSDSLSQVASEVPQLSNAVNRKKLEVDRRLQNSVDQMAERQKGQAATAARESLGGINDLSSMLASLIDQLKQQQGQGQGSGAGMSSQQLIEQLKKMSGQQAEMNKRIQEMINDMQGDRLSRSQINRLNQMAKQQNRIRKQLQQLQRSGALEPGDKLLSELERMNEQMEQTINDLRGGSTDRTLVKRQQNILSRMLSAEKAMEERGKEKKREATTADKQPKAVSPDITLEELQKQIRARLQDPNQTKFSDDYQKLIEKYFELLEKKRKQ